MCIRDSSKKVTDAERRNAYFKQIGSEGLLRKSGDGDHIEYNFLHLTFQEYFAARFIARKVKSMKKNDDEFWREALKNNKFHPRFAIVWWFVGGLLGAHITTDGNYDYLKKFIEEIGAPPHDLLYKYELTLQT
eukprot:TRINITY_DN15892_c0_g1_i1.p1 TRINITY_DN15892_c0_g1~~TRINITY_DN15892_c0_g1_i1.p1  ORF type:complete len:152 (+),score=39.90 TRINITY_DN15892_c0_g1_i1:58-456(+)